MKEAICIHCGQGFSKSPRHKNHNYCKKQKCRRAKKADWQRQKIRCDPEYKAGQKLSNRKWREANPGYWRKYRKKNPEKTERNRLLQRIRYKQKNIVKNTNEKNIAKMDSSKFQKINKFNVFGQYWLLPVIAKMDASRVNIVAISDNCQ